MRAHVVLPEEMIEEIDTIAGKRGRSHFIEEAVADKLRRARLLRALDETAGILDPADYPEWSTPEKTSQWVHDSRRQDDEHSRSQLPPPWGNREISPG
jgi:metal-responsive CopG/Arc/MetJ family transcriptional regulator